MPHRSAFAVDLVRLSAIRSSDLYFNFLFLLVKFYVISFRSRLSGLNRVWNFTFFNFVYVFIVLCCSFFFSMCSACLILNWVLITFHGGFTFPILWYECVRWLSWRSVYLFIFGNITSDFSRRFFVCLLYLFIFGIISDFSGGLFSLISLVHPKAVNVTQFLRSG